MNSLSTCVVLFSFIVWIYVRMIHFLEVDLDHDDMLRCDRDFDTLTYINTSCYFREVSSTTRMSCYFKLRFANVQQLLFISRRDEGATSSLAVWNFSSSFFIVSSSSSSLIIICTLVVAKCIITLLLLAQQQYSSCHFNAKNRDNYYAHMTKHYGGGGTKLWIMNFEV